MSTPYDDLMTEIAAHQAETDQAEQDAWFAGKQAEGLAHVDYTNVLAKIGDSAALHRAALEDFNVSLEKVQLTYDEAVEYAERIKVQKDLVSIKKYQDAISTTTTLPPTTTLAPTTTTSLPYDSHLTTS